MNGEAPMTGYTRLPRAVLRVWPGNPRKTVDPAAVSELAAAVRSLGGVKMPLVVRPLPAPLGDVTHEVIAGQRRYLAAGEADVEDLPVSIEVLDDAQALELALSENGSRRDAPPLEDAEAIERLIVEHGRSVERAAAILGRSVRWVERRRALMNLSEPSRAWVRANDVPVAHAEALAAVDADTQARVVERMQRRGIPSAREFAREITYALHLLSGAPFDVKATDLGGRGACTTCPHRSDTQKDLFFGGPQDGAHCLDASCWSEKLGTVWDRAVKGAKRRHLTVVDDAGKWLYEYQAGMPSASYDAPYALKGATPDAKPVAVARTPRGLVVELFEKPSKPAALTRGEAARVIDADGDEDEELTDEELAAAEAAENAERAKVRAERDAKEAATFGKLVELARDPASRVALARTALHSYLCDFDATPAILWARSLGRTVEARTREIDTVVGAFTDDEVPVVLLAMLAQSQIEAEPEERTPYEADILARLEAPAVPTVRVWIAEAAWDALSAEAREDLEEPIGGSPVAWEGREGWITAAVPEGEVLTALRGLAGAMELAMPEGDAQPATPAPVADAPARPEVELRVKRGVWLQHRSGLQDSAKGLLHKRWEAVEDQRVATLTTKDDAARGKVFDYCRRHGVPLAVDGVDVIVAKGGAR